MKSRLLREDAPLQCSVIPVTHVQQNCSVIWCAETLRGAVVDPGGEIDRVRAFIDERGIEVERLLVTHGHPDHAGAAADLAAQLEVPIEGPRRAEEKVIARMNAIADERVFNPYVSDFAAEDYEQLFDNPRFLQEHLLS